MAHLEILDGHADHIPQLRAVLDSIALFPAEMLPELMAPCLAGEADALWLTMLRDGRATGFCYARAEALTEGTWNMLALGVAASAQRSGLGARLVRALEERLRAKGARLLIVDTSGTAAFAPARSFYEACGYHQEARIRDFWAEGDDKITFRKALPPDTSRQTTSARPAR